MPVYHFYNDLLVGKVGKELPKFFFGGAGDSPTLMNEGTAFPDASGRYPFILPFQTYGDDMMLSWDYTHEYTNPVTPEGWPRSSTGPRTTPSEHFTFNFSKRELEDRSLPTVRFTAGFTRLSECWPFMQMGGTAFAGATLFGRMFSHKGLNGLDDVPPKVRAYVEKHAPEFLTVPDGWTPDNSRVDTWKAYPRTSAGKFRYPWKPSTFKVPSAADAARRSGSAATTDIMRTNDIRDSLGRAVRARAREPGAPQLGAGPPMDGGAGPAFPSRLKTLLPGIANELQNLVRVRSEHVGADGSTRLLLDLADGQAIETVLLPPAGVCVSTQVGCAVGCTFCMTGREGLLRHLGSAEIVAQVALARRRQTVRKVVFMGMGEPAHNLDNVLEAIHLLGTAATSGTRTWCSPPSVTGACSNGCPKGP